MANSINTNLAAANAVYNVNIAAARQLESAKRLSTGTRLNNTSDDAGATAVSMRNEAALGRMSAVDGNVMNALSFLQCQSGGLGEVYNTLSRMSQLATRMTDSTKNATDLNNYLAEFNDLRQQMGAQLEEKYNGMNLFNFQGAPRTLNVYLNDTGTQSIEISQSDFTQNSGWLSLLGNSKPYTGTVGATDTVANITDENVWGSSSFQLMITDLASLSATNGAQQSRLMYALDAVRKDRSSLYQANGRMTDTNVASEMGSLSRASVLLQSGSNILSKANGVDQALLKILGA
jgi:flagellin